MPNDVLTNHDQKPVVGRIVGLFRYPVKSMRGEALVEVAATESGVAGDRSFGVIDSQTGRLLSAKTVPKLLSARSTLRLDGEVTIELPGASVGAPTILVSNESNVNEALSNWLDRSVQLLRPAIDQVADIDIEVDMSDHGKSDSEVFTFQSRRGMFFDSTPLHLLTTASLNEMKDAYPDGNWAVDRFRPNMLIEVISDDRSALGFVEDAWVGGSLGIGTAVIQAVKRCDRCVLTTRAVADAPVDRNILRTLHAVHNGDLGVKATVGTNGTLKVGDVVRLISNAGE
jgi:uncharacterized protein